MFKKTFNLLFASLVVFLPSLAFAQNTGDCSKSTSLWKSFGGSSLLSIFPQYCDPELTTLFVLKTLILLVGVVATVAIMWSGYKWMTAAGDPNKMKSARQGIMYAAIGLIVVLLSSVIITFASELVTGKNPSDSSTSSTANPASNSNSANSTPQAQSKNILVTPKFSYTNLLGKNYRKISVALAAEQSVLTSLCGSDPSTYTSNLLIDGSAVIQDPFQSVSDTGFTSTLNYSKQLYDTSTVKSVDVKVCGLSVSGFPQDIDFGPQ